MGVYIREQETVINIMRTDDMADVYTSDVTMMTKLDHLVEDSKFWKMTEEIRDKEGNLVAKRYECPKKLISMRRNIIEREMTEEQRQAAADRFRDYWAQKRQEKQKEKKEQEESFMF